MGDYRNFADIRREYGDLGLAEEMLQSDPFEQFKLWFQEVIKSETHDPNAMVLSTVDEQGWPDSRVVLLKEIQDRAFVFYTNYLSSKGTQLNINPFAALNFYWPTLSRQVRIRGKVKKVSEDISDQYFSTRPIKSQLSAMISQQSKEIDSRASLENKLNELFQKTGQESVVRPSFWGGYMVMPEEFEFWQGRDNRLHDRIHYYKKGASWLHRRLAP